MFSYPLFKQNVRSNYKVFLVFFAILTMYFGIIVTMYDPTTQETMEAFLKALPPELINAMNFNLVDATYTGFLASYLYGFLMLLFPLIYIILTANRLVARHVDHGSMACLLSTPVSRKKVIRTQMLYLTLSILLLILLTTLLAAALSEAMFPGLLDYTLFFQMNLGLFLLHFAIGSISFLASCMFNDTRNALALGAGLPVFFFLARTLGNVGEPVAFLKYVSLFSLFDPHGILAGAPGVLLQFLALALLGLVLHVAALYLFHRRDLPL